MKIKVRRYEVVKPQSVAEAMDAWDAAPDGKAKFESKWGSGFTMGDAKTATLEWLMEPVEVDDSELASVKPAEDRKVKALESIAGSLKKLEGAIGTEGLSVFREN